MSPLTQGLNYRSACDRVIRNQASSLWKVAVRLFIVNTTLYTRLHLTSSILNEHDDDADDDDDVISGLIVSNFQASE